MPRVSIGMPVYNGAHYLRKALDALLAQDFRDFEILISDNASTDETPQICSEYRKKDQRIRYYRHETNFVAVKNFNWVFQQCSGEYFMWAAYDDLWAETFLSRCVELMDQKPKAVLCTTHVHRIDELGRKTDAPDYGFETLDLNVCQRVRYLIRYSASCTAMYGLFRREALLKTHLFRQTWYPDFCFLFELSLFGGTVCVPEKLFLYREFLQKREKGLLMTMRSICDADTKAPRYPFTGIFLMTQAWKVLYEIIAAAQHIDRKTKCMLAFTTTFLFFNLWRAGIFRDHKIRLYLYYESNKRFYVLCAGILCLLFKPGYVLNSDFQYMMIHSFLGDGLTVKLKNLSRKFFKKRNTGKVYE